MKEFIKTIDLNCDLGEGYHDVQIFPYISSCNIACGGHYGNKETIRKTIHSALKHNIAIGAHPSYPDKENFGRRELDISIQDLKESLERQLSTFKEICTQLNTKPTHIKPHGALYNKMASDKEFSKIITDSFHTILPDATIFCLAESEAQNTAQEMKVRFIREGFSDRAYTIEKTLVSRSIKGAVLTEWSQVKKQIAGLLIGFVTTIENETIALNVDSICLHGDTPNAALTIRSIYEYVKSMGYEVHSYR